MVKFPSFKRKNLLNNCNNLLIIIIIVFKNKNFTSFNNKTIKKNNLIKLNLIKKNSCKLKIYLSIQYIDKLLIFYYKILKI